MPDILREVGSNVSTSFVDSYVFEPTKKDIQGLHVDEIAARSKLHPGKLGAAACFLRTLLFTLKLQDAFFAC